MSNWIKIGLILICTTLFSGCGDYESNNGCYLRGTHNLLALNNGTAISGKISGDYFLFVGGMSGSFKQENYVKFIWQNNQGEFIPSVLPYNRVRFVFSETDAPSVKFRWSPYDVNNANIMDAVVYAVFTVKPNHIKSDINFNIEK